MVAVEVVDEHVVEVVEWPSTGIDNKHVLNKYLKAQIEFKISAPIFI